MDWYERLRIPLKRSTLLTILLIGVAAIIAANIAVNWGPSAVQRAEPVEICRRIRLGMTRDKVLEIMPDPVGRISYKRHGRQKEKLIFPSREDAPTPPQLVIDALTGHVEEVVCDENYRLIHKPS